MKHWLPAIVVLLAMGAAHGIGSYILGSRGNDGDRMLKPAHDQETGSFLLTMYSS